MYNDTQQNPENMKAAVKLHMICTYCNDDRHPVPKNT